MRFFKSVQTLVSVVLLILLGGFGGYYLGLRGYEINVKKETRSIEVINKNDTISNSVDFAQFWQVWEIVNNKHINRPLDPSDLLDGAIRGMVSAIGDPYTAFLNVEQNEVAVNSLNGQYEGIGAQLGFNEQDRLIIVAPLDGSPARAVGVQAGDIIVGIEGEDTLGISITEAVNKIRGPAGTVSTLTLARNGVDEPFVVKIVRDTITVKSVVWEDKGDGIVYIRLSRFGGSTNEEWSRSVSEIVSQMPNLKAIVLDVRNNPGGYLESAVFIASEFIEKGVVVKEDFVNGVVNEFKVDHAGRLADEKLDLVVVINQGSASASEIVAAALKERRDAALVGVRSFGKGSVQKSEEFEDGSALHVTVAKWLTPEGNWVDSQSAKFKDSKYNEIDKDGNEIVGGLKPDFIVEVTDENVKNGKDLQLDKALEILRK